MTVLFFIGSIIFFLGVDWLVRKLRREEQPQPAPARPAHLYPVRVPEGIFFTRSHTWLNLFPSGKLRLGIDDFVGRLLDKPAISFLKSPGDVIERGEPILALTSGEHILTVRSPIGGKVLEVNGNLASHPEILRKDLFSEGWGYLIKPNHLGQLREFLLGDETRTWIREEFRRLSDLFAGVMKGRTGEPLFLQDGGLPVPGVMEKMDDSVWKEFESKFLKVQ